MHDKYGLWTLGSGPRADDAFLFLEREGLDCDHCMAASASCSLVVTVVAAAEGGRAESKAGVGVTAEEGGRGGRAESRVAASSMAGVGNERTL